MISSRCPECDSLCKIPDQHAGSYVECPYCGEEFRAKRASGNGRSSQATTTSPSKSRVSRSEVKSRARYDDDYDDEEEFTSRERKSGGRGKNRPEPQQGLTGQQWGLIAGGATLLAALVVVLVLVLGGDGDSSDSDKDNRTKVADNDSGGQPPIRVPPGGNPPNPGNNFPPVNPGNKPPGNNDPGNKPPGNNNPNNNNPPINPGNNNPPPTNDDPPLKIDYTPLTGEQIYNRTVQSTAWIFVSDRTSYGWGSGSLVDRRRKLVVTNYHVVLKRNEVTVFFPAYTGAKPIAQAKHYLGSGQIKKIGLQSKVVWRNPKVDLALVQLPYVPKEVLPLPLASSSPATASNVHVIGASGVDIRTLQGALWQYVKGEVRSATRRNDLRFQLPGREILNLDAEVVETTGATNKGDSGGPVVNDRGELVAVVQGGDPSKNNVAFNISVKEVRGALAEHYRSQGMTWVEENVAVLRSKPNVSAAALVEQLKHSRASVRVDALKALKDLGTEASVAWKKILPVLDDGDELVRRAARDTLDALGPLDRFDVDELRKLLKHNNFRHRRFAALQLGKLERNAGGATSDLIAVMDNDENRFVRQEAIVALGALQGSARAAVPSLCKLVETASDAELICCAIESLGRIRETNATVTQALDKAFAHTNPEVQAKAFQAMLSVDSGRITLEKVVKAAESPSPELSGVAQQELNRREKTLGAADVPGVREALKSKKKNIRFFAMRVVARLKAAAKDAAPELADLASVRDTETRLEAMTTLAEMKAAAKEVAPKLMPLLEDPDRMVQGTAAYCITMIRAKLSPEQVNDLLKKLVRAAAPETNREIVNQELEGVGLKIAELLVRIGKPSADAICLRLGDRKNPIQSGEAGVVAKRVWLSIVAKIGRKGHSKFNYQVVEYYARSDPSLTVKLAAAAAREKMLGR